MDILVTGGSGFIGGHVVDALVDEGHSVTVLDTKEPHRADVDFVDASVLDRDAVGVAVKGREVVYHLAGFSNIDRVADHPIDTVELNVLGTAYLLEAARRERCARFILAGTVYSHAKQGHLYTTTKRASEEMCVDYHTLYGLPYTVLRYGTVYGPRSRGADVISLFVGNALRAGEVCVRGSGEQKRNFIFAADAGVGAVKALAGTCENRTLVLAGPEEVSIIQLAGVVAGLFPGLRIIHEEASDRIDDYGGAIAGLEESYQALGWRPSVSIEDGVRLYLEWLKEAR